MIVIFVLFPISAYGWEGTITRIADGDTVHVLALDGASTTKIRLYGIDCPEKKQTHGPVATDFINLIAAIGTRVSVDHIEFDRYRRSVAILKTDNANVNEALVANGHAWVYPRYCRKAVCSHWKELENKARIQRSGLWQAKDPQPPWEWRKQKR